MDEIEGIRRTHLMVLSGPDLHTLLNIADDERGLDRDLHILQRRLQEHA